MMMIMFEALSTIVDAITTVFGLLVNSVTGLIALIGIIFDFLAYFALVIAEMPAPLLAFAMVGVLVSVILLVLGRQS